MKQHMIMTLLVVALVTGVAGFYAGTRYQAAKQPNFAAFRDRQAGTVQRNTNTTGARGGLRPVSGEIIKHDDTSVTVKLSDGSSKIVMLTKITTVNKAVEGTKDDLTDGTNISVFGTENADGSVSAQNIQIRSGIPASPSPEAK